MPVLTLKTCPGCGARSLNPAPGDLCARCAYGTLVHLPPSHQKRIKQLRQRFKIGKVAEKPKPAPSPKRVRRVKRCVVCGGRRERNRCFKLCQSCYSLWKRLDYPNKPWGGVDYQRLKEELCQNPR
jgi:ribosomal protein S14